MRNIIVWADIPVPGMDGVAIPGPQPDAEPSSSPISPAAFDLYVGGPRATGRHVTAGC